MKVNAFMERKTGCSAGEPWCLKVRELLRAADQYRLRMRYRTRGVVEDKLLSFLLVEDGDE
jgi:hypothetical protein